MKNSRLAKALAFAEKAHHGQTRKGSETPYISHPKAVCDLVLKFGGSEDQAVAALLHDTIEDCGATAAQIEKEFGSVVAQIVEECSDWNGCGEKPAWRARKEAFIAKLGHVRVETLLVVACDKLHNSSDLSPQMMKHFSAPAHEVEWYYHSVFEALSKRAQEAGPSLMQALKFSAAQEPHQNRSGKL